ncbi:MAG: hypothetical protein ABI880_09010 [Acidobacteriota bacterium]
MSCPSALRAALAAAVLLLKAATVQAAGATLGAAEAHIVFTAPATCEVTLALAVIGVAEVEHRLESLDGSHTELLEVSGGEQIGGVTVIGRTLALTVRLPAVNPPAAPLDGARRHTVRYRVQQTPDRAYRCPIWLPTAPADGVSRRVVQMSVSVPPGQTAGGTMPVFTWTGSEGSAALPHLPAFVVVPFAAEGSAPPWDVSRVMDAAALGTLAAASAMWARRQRRARA